MQRPANDANWTYMRLPARLQPIKAESIAIMYRVSRDDAATVSRREFLHAAAAISGGLALALKLPAQENATARPAAASAPRTPSAFIQIAADDSITIITPAVEMGQGGHTAMPMIIMEELGGDWQRLRVEDAAAAAIYNNPMFGQQSTVGSFSVRGWFTELRRIGAAAREMLVQAAASDWRVPADECSVADSTITHAPSGRTRSFGSVAALAAALPVPQQPMLKSVASFGLIGSSPQRVDLAVKVDGSARYGIDMVLPQMLYAAVKTCPTFAGKLRSFDDSAARKLPGYHSTVALPDGVIVTARSYWQARKALDQVTVDYELGSLASLDSARVSQLLREGFDQAGTIARNDGDVNTAMGSAAKVMQAQYEVPYLAHACMEPMNCTARVDEDGCEIWCGTQTPQAAQSAAAAVLNIAPERVKVNTLLLGGGYCGQGDRAAGEADLEP
jgi:isoquinoline 1-oxidoreductase beta subunit